MIAFLLLLLVAPALASSLRPQQLRCEYLTNPLGIDEREPRLSWVLAPADPKARGLRQTAYRILVASDEPNLRAGKGDLWDTGRVASDQSVHVVYRGRPLASRMRAHWKVQVWDQDGKASPWSEPASWSMGLLEPGDWSAKWIGRDEESLYKDPSSPYWSLAKSRWIWSGAEAGGARFFRTTFTVPSDRKITSATAIIGAVERYALTLNGQAVGRGSHFQMPEVFDVASLIRPGSNLVRVRATSRANRPAGLITALRVEFSGGGSLVVSTGPEWEVSADESVWAPAKDLGPYGAAPWGEVGFSEERTLPARTLRKEFDVSKKLRRATAYVSGLGLFELYLNGNRIGDHVLSPALSDYDKRVYYVTFDVTQHLKTGRNAAGLILGNGRYWAPRAAVPIGMRSYGYPKAILQLELDYEDGTRATVVTDETWQLSTRGPIRANNEFDGEEYDARQEPDDWEPARLVSPPSGALAAQMAEPLRVTETRKPVKITQPRPGAYVFDMGQNMVGWCRLHVSGPRGTRITLRHAETLGEDGNLYVDNLRSARATDSYILKGGGEEVWEPRFTYHGFRYVEVRGFPGAPTPAALEGRVVHDALTPIADFSSSSELLNRIHRNILWGVRGNYRSIPTDCPQRDERQGWLGDRSMVSRSESYLHDVAAFYTKWMTDLADAQRPSGSIPDVAPAYWVLYNDSLTWPGTLLFLPGMLYEQYGDRRAVERHYPALKKWIDYMRSFLKDDLMPKDTYGDWCVPPESPKLIHSQDPARRTDGTLIGTSYFYALLNRMARYARVLDKPQDALDFEALAGRVRTAFEKKFFNRAAGVYSNGTQTSSILPLAFGITPPEDRARIFGGLVRKIEQESDNHIGVGLVGAQWLMRTLSDNGRADLAYTIATQTTYPGWGYMIGKGATTIWELWNGDTADPAMNSGNHVMQVGDLGVWLYEYLAGIRSDHEKPGFKHILVRPYLAGDLTFVKASHASMYGTIASHWKRDGGQLQLEVTIPPNTTATVYVPARDRRSVTESSGKGVQFLRMEENAAMFAVGSGHYAFRSVP